MPNPIYKAYQSSKKDDGDSSPVKKESALKRFADPLINTAKGAASLLQLTPADALKMGYDNLTNMSLESVNDNINSAKDFVKNAYNNPGKTAIDTAKFAAGFLPFVGGLPAAYDKFKEGNYAGAAGEGLVGAIPDIPEAHSLAPLAAGIPLIRYTGGKGWLVHGATRPWVDSITGKFTGMLDRSRLDKSDTLGEALHAVSPKNSDSMDYAERYAEGSMKYKSGKVTPQMIAIDANARDYPNTLDIYEPDNMDDISQVLAHLPEWQRRDFINNWKFSKRTEGIERANKILGNALRGPLNNPKMMEALPFDAIRYNDAGYETFAIPPHKRMQSYYGKAPLSEPEGKPLTITRLPDDAPASPSVLKLADDRWKHTSMGLADSPVPEYAKLGIPDPNAPKPMSPTLKKKYDDAVAAQLKKSEPFGHTKVTDFGPEYEFPGFGKLNAAGAEKLVNAGKISKSQFENKFGHTKPWDAPIEHTPEYNDTGIDVGKNLGLTGKQPKIFELYDKNDKLIGTAESGKVADAYDANPNVAYHVGAPEGKYKSQSPVVKVETPSSEFIKDPYNPNPIPIQEYFDKFVKGGSNKTVDEWKQMMNSYPEIWKGYEVISADNIPAKSTNSFLPDNYGKPHDPESINFDNGFDGQEPFDYATEQAKQLGLIDTGGNVKDSSGKTLDDYFEEFGKDSSPALDNNIGEVGTYATELQSKYPELKKYYDMNSGTEMGSIGEHTQDVEKLAAQQLDFDAVNLAATNLGIMWPHLEDAIADGIALHDIGKGEAIKAGNKNAQHEHTIPIMEKYLAKQGHNQKTINFVKELFDHDLIGSAIQYKNWTPEELVEKFQTKAKRAGVNPKTFLDIQLALYYADAGSYPYVRDNFMKKNMYGKLEMKDSRFINELIAGISKK